MMSSILLASLSPQLSVGLAPKDLDYDAFRLVYEKARGPVSSFDGAGVCDDNPSICTWVASEGAYVIDGDGDVVIRGKAIAATSRDSYALIVRNHHSGTVSIDRSYFYGSNVWQPYGVNNPGNGLAIAVYDSSNVHITNSFFEGCGGKIINVDGGLAARDNIRIEFNSALNMNAGKMQDYGPDAHFVAFNNVATGTGNSVSHNRVLNYPGFSFTTDVFNFYQSAGADITDYNNLEDPNWLRIRGNLILGANYYNFWGSGTQIADHMPGYVGPNSHHLASDNVYVFAGAWAGINVNGGFANMVRDNFAYMEGSVCGYNPSTKDWTCTEPYAGFGLQDGYDPDLSPRGNAWLTNNLAHCPSCSDRTFGLINIPDSVVSGNDDGLSLGPLELLGEGFMAGGCPAKRHYWSQNGAWCSGVGSAVAAGAEAVVGSQSGTGQATVRCDAGQYLVDKERSTCAVTIV